MVFVDSPLSVRLVLIAFSSGQEAGESVLVKAVIVSLIELPSLRWRTYITLLIIIIVLILIIINLN